MSDITDRSVTTIMTVLISVVLVCSALIPISMDQIKAMMEKFTESAYGQDIANMVGQLETILFIVLIVVVIGLVIGVVKGYTRGDNEQD